MALEKRYNHQEVEPRIAKLWERGDYFTPQVDPHKKPFSIILWPPNASGEMHVGNVLMIAIQDILARYHRARGYSTLWIPSSDHGGYETQVTFERELEKIGKDKSTFSNKELFTAINQFVSNNNSSINNQIKSAGASVDWTRFRFTMDDEALKSTDLMFKKMVSDNLIYRRPYMVHYCPQCSTVLSDIELKENKDMLPLYFIKFYFQDSPEYLSLATIRPEFLFATTHLLIHPQDERYAKYIGKTLINPTTNKAVEIVTSKRKFDPKEPEPFLTPFSPSHNKYDYEYTLRNAIPSQNLLDWNGKMLDRYLGLTPLEARKKEVAYLKEKDFIEKVDETHIDSTYLCKRGHVVENLIVLTWFLKLDDKQKPLRQPAIEAVKKGGLIVVPNWREKGLIQWLEKMPDWPIARQNVWGIKIPIWYEISDPTQFIVWFIDKRGKRQYGNLKTFLDAKITLEEIAEGLQRIYASESVIWSLEKESGKTYLPETDTFDTWFSSGDWSVMAFGDMNAPDFSYFYPSQSLVIGHDLLRLSVVREIFLGLYVTGKLPFKIVYLHRLIKGKDGRKMSKSLGNAVSVSEYLEKFGADVTRMALISYTDLQEDFILEEARLYSFKNFSERLWKMGKVVDLANQYSPDTPDLESLSVDDKNLISTANSLPLPVSSYIEKYLFAYAEEKICSFIETLEQYVKNMETKKNIAVPLAVFKSVFKKYLITLHPFMPFMTEELFQSLYRPISPLAATAWPNKN